MKSDLVPIRIVFGRRDDGSAAYPDFNEVPVEIRRGLKWSHYMDTYGTGMSFRDKVENLGTGHTQGRIVTCVPKDFAEDAAQRFEEVEIISEAECRRFYEERCTVYEHEELVDNEVLQGIKTQIDLEDRGLISPPDGERKTSRDKALDPKHHRVAGVRRNVKKKWAGLKRELGISIHRDYAE